MDKKRIDSWIWPLIYGGMLGIILGWFIPTGNAALGLTLMIGGGMVTAIGVALIFVRARLGP